MKLDSLCTRITVGHVGPMVNEYVDDGIPFLRSQNVRPFRLNLDDVKFITPAFHARLKKCALQPGDIVVVRTGYPGTAAVVPGSLAEANCADLVVLSPSKDLLDPHYLVAVFNSTWGRATVSGNLVGAAQQHFNIGAARNLEISFPGIEEQRRIAGILSAYDDLIENCERRIRMLDEMARSLYREWFVLGQGAKVGRFDEVADIQRGSVDPRSCPDEVFAHFSIPAFDAGRRPAVEAGGQIQSVKTLLSPDCVLLSKLNPRIPRVWMPRLPAGLRAIASTEFLSLQGKHGVATAFLYCLCSSQDFIASFAGLAIGTSTSHQRVKPDSLLQMQVPVPTSAAIRDFTAAAAPRLDLAEVLRERVVNLRATRDLLLPRLLSGQLSVDDAA